VVPIMLAQIEPGARRDNNFTHRAPC